MLKASESKRLRDQQEKTLVKIAMLEIEANVLRAIVKQEKKALYKIYSGGQVYPIVYDELEKQGYSITELSDASSDSLSPVQIEITWS